MPPDGERDVEVKDLRRIYTPNEAGVLYGPDDEPISREEADRRAAAGDADPPTVECDYCGRKAEKERRRLRLGGQARWQLPDGWRELPNKLTECPNCRPVRDLETGRMIRPDPEHRGG